MNSRKDNHRRVDVSVGWQVKGIRTGPTSTPPGCLCTLGPKLQAWVNFVSSVGFWRTFRARSFVPCATTNPVKVFATCRRLIHCAPKRTNFRIWSKVLQLKHVSLSSSFRTEFSFACGWSSKKNFSQLVFRRYTFLQLKIYGRFSIHKYFFIQDWSQACDDIGRDPTAITFVLRVWRHIWDLVCLVEWISFETKLQRLWNVSYKYVTRRT